MHVRQTHATDVEVVSRIHSLPSTSSAFNGGLALSASLAEILVPSIAGETAAPQPISPHHKALTVNITLRVHPNLATKPLEKQLNNQSTIKMSLSNKLAITDVDLKDKRVLIRVRPLLSMPSSRLTVPRSTSTSPSTARRSQTPSESPVPSRLSSMRSKTAPRPSSSCPTLAAPMAR